MTETVAAAVVLAGGSGTRVGAGRNKVHLRLAGRPVLAWSLATFAGMSEIGPIVLVARPQDRAAAEELLHAEAGPSLMRVEVVDGGATRQESELCGLRRLAERVAAGLVDAVLVHDGARPLMTAAVARSVLAAARAHGGAVPVLPPPDLAVVDPAAAVTKSDGRDDHDGRDHDGRDGRDSRDGHGAVRLAGAAPSGLVAVQTPQGFRAAPLLAACQAAARAGFVATDTASCVERFGGLSTCGVPGDEHNIKITYPQDLRVAGELLARLRPPPPA